MKRIRLVLVLAAAFLMAFASAAAAQQVDAVPNVTGMKAADAQQMLTRQGWKTGMEYRTVADPKQDGTVLATRPPAGARVSKQQVVIVVAGKMADQTRVPNVTNMPLAEAQKALVANKLNASVIRENTADPGKNQVVLKQMAAPGMSMAPGSTVPLVVGQYTPPAQVKVPSVMGKPLAEAQKILVDNKLNAQVTHQPVANPNQNGMVIGQKIAVGTPLAPGSMVPVIVGTYTAPAAKPVPNVKGMPGGPAMQRLQSQGWKVEVQRKPVTDTKQHNVVLQQSPEPGAQVVPAQQAVTLFVGQYHETVRVPSIVGMKGEQAKVVLEQAKLKMNAGARTVQDRTKIGTVLDQNPAPGTAVESGSQVVVTMGLDPKAKIAGPQNNPYYPYNPPITPDSTGSTK